MTPVVQAWRRGEPNYGLIVMLTAGAANARYYVSLAEHTDQASLPRLVLEYR